MRRLAIALALLFVHASTAGSAWAHATLVRAEPADGAVMPRPPPTWTLTFNEPVAPLVVRLISPAGELGEQFRFLICGNESLATAVLL